MNKNLNDYVKVVYQTDPIGKEQIILYLTTFDIDKYNHDIEKKNFGIEIPIEKSYLNNMFDDYLQTIESQVNDYVRHFYEPYIKEAKEYVQLLKTTYQHEITPKIYDNANNIVNADNVHCNIVYGNITNCDNIYCNEIKGKVVNCDRIIYKKEE